MSELNFPLRPGESKWKRRGVFRLRGRIARHAQEEATGHRSTQVAPPDTNESGFAEVLASLREDLGFEPPISKSEDE